GVAVLPAAGAEGRELAVGVVVGVHGEAELLQIVLTAHPGRRLADFLHRGQQQPDEDGDDGDHYQEFDQGEARAESVRPCHGTLPERRRMKLRNRHGESRDTQRTAGPAAGVRIVTGPPPVSFIAPVRGRPVFRSSQADEYDPEWSVRSTLTAP